MRFTSHNYASRFTNFYTKLMVPCTIRQKSVTVFIEYNDSKVSIILYDIICTVNSPHLYKNEQ